MKNSQNIPEEAKKYHHITPNITIENEIHTSRGNFGLLPSTARSAGLRSGSLVSGRRIEPGRRPALQSRGSWAVTRSNRNQELSLNQEPAPRGFAYSSRTLPVKPRQAMAVWNVPLARSFDWERVLSPPFWLAPKARRYPSLGQRPRKRIAAKS